ncbi:hypothetical protein [Flagellimonas sp.]|uniref:hypothetical protein n=1 Tax=Flagellimonas sp. TaxID=2058762 RepID=UPI003B58CD53
MILKKVVVVVLTFLLFSSCGGDDDSNCHLVDCAGFPALGFEIILNDENVFTKGDYTLQDVSIEGDQSDKVQPFLAPIYSVNKFNILVLEIKITDEGSHELTVNLADDFLMDINLNVALSPSGGCCGGIPYLTQAEINGEEYGSNPFFTITLD